MVELAQALVKVVHCTMVPWGKQVQVVVQLTQQAQQQMNCLNPNEALSCMNTPGATWMRLWLRAELSLLILLLLTQTYADNLTSCKQGSFYFFTLTLYFLFPLFVLLNQQGFPVKFFKETMSYPFLILLICLKLGITERWRGRSSICCLNLHMPPMSQECARLEARVFLQDPHVHARGPNIWTIFCCFSQVINNQLDWKQWPTGELVSQAIALPRLPQLWPAFSFLSSSFF